MRGRYTSTMPSLKPTCQNCLFDWRAPRSHRGRWKRTKTSIPQLASVDSVFMWAVDQTDNVVQPFLTKLNHNYDAILKRFPSQCYKPRIELRGFLPAENCTQSLRKWNDQKDDKNYYSPKYWMIHSQACKGRSSVNIGRFYDERKNNIKKKLIP